MKRAPVVFVFFPREQPISWQISSDYGSGAFPPTINPMKWEARTPLSEGPRSPLEHIIPGVLNRWLGTEMSGRSWGGAEMTRRRWEGAEMTGIHTTQWQTEYTLAGASPHRWECSIPKRTASPPSVSLFIIIDIRTSRTRPYAYAMPMAMWVCLWFFDREAQPLAAGVQSQTVSVYGMGSPPSLCRKSTNAKIIDIFDAEVLQLGLPEV